MVKLLSVAFVAAATCLIVTSPVEAQNAAVHAANFGESRAATPAPATKPAAGAKTPAQPTGGAAPTKPATGAATPAKPTTGAATPAAGSSAKPPATAGGTKPTAATPTSPGAAATTPAKPATGATTPAGPTSKPPAADNKTPTRPTSAPPTTPKPGATLAADKTWVQNFKAKPNDKACYRRTAFASKTKECPVGYNFDDALVCWAQCPIEYPVQCGMECLPQNKDCTLNVLGKVSAVASAAVTAATGGFFGEMIKAAKGLTRAVGCAQQVYDVTTRIYDFIDEAQALGQATTAEKANTVVQQSDLFTIDMPTAVATCLGQELPKAFDQTKKLLTVAKTIVEDAVEKKFTKEDLKNKLKFLEWFKKVNTTDSAATKTAAPSTTQPPTQQTAQLPKTADDIKKYNNWSRSVLVVGLSSLM